MDDLGNDRVSPTPQGPEHPAGPSSSQGQPDEFAGKGYLLEADDKAVFRRIHEGVVRQELIAKNDESISKHWARVRRGIPFSVLKKDEDRNTYTAELPPGVDDTASPTPNNADHLCRTIVSQITIDVPKADPKPATDSEQDRGSADVSKRFLSADGDESGTNDAELFRDCEDSAQTFASAFAHVWTDPQGGGWRPLQIKAHPQATDANQPLVAMDATGQPIPTADYTLRYVDDQGQFVENASQAAMQWLPKIKRDVLLPAHVRTHPETADISGANAVTLLMCGPLSDLERRIGEGGLDNLSDDTVQALAEWRPPRHKVLVAPAIRPKLKSGDTAVRDGKSPTDDTLVYWYQHYCEPGGDYPDGAQLIVTGAESGIVLKKATLRKDLPQDDGTVRVLLRSIPVSQCKAMLDSEGRNRWGRRPIELFGATNEGLSQLYGGVVSDIDRRLNPNIFTTATTTVQDWQLTQRTGEPITVLGKDDMPMYEQFADFPGFLPQIIEKLEESMRNAAMVSQTAQALDSPYSISGKAKQISVQQSKVALAPVAQPFFAFVKRYWRIKLETAQAELTVPQQVEYTGIDGAYKQRWWTGADFSGVKNVAIMAGTGTMMSQAEKQQYIGYAQSAGWMDPEESAEVGRSTLADDLGLAPSPHEELISRQLASWLEGPPDGWEQQYAAYQQAQAQAQAVQQAAAAVGAQVPQQPMPPLWNPFEPRPTDDDQSVAKVRYRKLRDFVATSDYSKHPPSWRWLIDQAYTQARYNAGVITVAQQAQQAQAAALQQQAKQQPTGQPSPNNQQPSSTQRSQ